MNILYSTGCPSCKILKSMLDSKNIKYIICSDVDIMQEKGFTSLPVLEVEGITMKMATAISWIKSFEPKE